MSLAKLFYMKETLRERVRQWRHACFRKRAYARRTERFTLEPLEARVLLSATPTEVIAPQELTTAAVSVPHGPHPSLDVDLNGQADALSDGILIIRHLFGFTGTALTDGVVDPAGQRTDPTEIENYLNSINSAFDVDLNQNADALSDGIVIIRSLFGFTGTTLTDGVVDPGGQRSDPAVIAAFLDNMNPARELVAPLMTAGLQQDTGLSTSDAITFNPTITGTLADISQIASFTAGFDATPAGSFVTVLTDLLPTGAFTLSTARLNQLAGSTLADGSHTLHLRATDVRGNVATVDRAFTLDTVAPAGSLALAASSDTGPVGDRLTTLDVVTLTGQTDSLATIVLANNGATTTADTTGLYAFSGFALAEGTNQISVTMTDRAGNQGHVVQTITQQGADGSILLKENSSWVVDVSTPIDLATTAGTRTLRLTLEPQFDTTSTTAIAEDTFLISLVNPADLTDTLLDRGQNGTALFALHGTTAEFQAGLVTFDGTGVAIDLTSLGAQATGLLRLQLVNHDSDSGSQIRVRTLTNIVNSTGTPPTLFPLSTTLVSRGGAVDLSGYSLTATAHAEVENVRIDQATGRYTAELSLHNTGVAIGRQAVVLFGTLPAGVTLRNASGVDAMGHPYLNLAPAIPSGGLGPMGMSDAVLLEFDNPNFTPFALTAQVLVGPPNQAPVLAPIGPLTVFPGGHLEVPLTASDPDGDRVAYFIRSAGSLPTSMLKSNGTLVITPAPGEEGTYPFTVVASDGVKESTQAVTLTVAPDPTATTRISGKVVGTTGEPLAGIPIEVGRIITLTAADGTFTLDLPAILVPTASFNITIPTGDIFFDPFNTGTQFISMRRAGFDSATGTSTANPLQHPNLVTSFLDGNIVYGSDPDRALALRTLQGGKLKTSAGNLLPFNSTTFFPNGPLENDNGGNADPGSLFVAGDVRASENVALEAMHTILLREHNRLADEIATASPGSIDETIYQQARRWLIGELQHIVYSEYLPVLLGPDALPAYIGYTTSADPAVSAVFATAAFRLGHSQMVSQLLRLDATGTSLASGPLNLRDAFFTTAPITADGIDPIVRGLLAQQAQEIDSHVVDELRNFLFGPPGSGGMDLVSLNIQRGRDMGLPSYTQARLDFGLSPITSFSQITSDVAAQQMLQSVYGTVDKIDVWVGGIAEDHAAGALIGPLFQKIIADQFTRTRNADRFWYENSQFTAAELAQIRTTTFADLIARNSGLTNLSGNVFTTNTSPAAPAPAGSAATAAPIEYRSSDGSGNNQITQTLGQTGTNLKANFTQSYGDGISTPGGADRPGAREISNAVFPQTGSIPNTQGATALAVFFGQILSHDLSLTATGITDTMKIHGDQAAPAGTYPFVAEKLPLMLGHQVYAGLNNVIARPIFLPALDMSNAVTIDPTKDVMVSTTAIPSTALSVAAGTLEDREGNMFTGQLSITRVPSTLTPASLPPGLNPDLVVTIQPAEMVFTTPAPLTLPNTGGLEPGTIMDLWSIDPLSGTFDIVGTMQVSTDGSVIETIEGGIRNSSWHTAVPQESEDPPEMEDNKCNRCEAGSGSTSISDNTSNYSSNYASEVSFYTGEVTEAHNLVSYQSQGVSRGVSLVYSSLRADPRPIIQLGSSNVVPSPDRYFVAKLVVNRTEVPGGTMPGRGDTGWHFWQVPETDQPGGLVNVEASLQADLTQLPTGRYFYSATYGLQNYRLEETIGGQLLPERFVGTTSTFNGEIISVNEIGSVFGAGWGVAGVQKLVQTGSPVGSVRVVDAQGRVGYQLTLFPNPVILIDGNGSQLAYAPESFAGIGIRFSSPVGDFSTLEASYDVTFGGTGSSSFPIITITGYVRTATDRTVWRYAANGLLTSITDRNGNLTHYEYDVNDHLTSMIDPVGLATTFAYAGNRVTAITDPANRVTLLEYDSVGNLIRITDPDSGQRTWSYDTRHHMVGEIDQRGNSEQEFYDFAGRATSAIRKDGTMVQVAPVDTRSLFRPELTSDWHTAPTAKIRQPKESSFTLPNGNVIRTLLDGAGQATLTLDSLGQLPSVQRNSDNLVVQSVDAAGNVSRYTYDSKGNLLSMRDSFSGGNRISAGIGQPGERDSYTFTLEQASHLYFDSLTNNSSLQWSLTGPQGPVVTNRLFTASDASTLFQEAILNLQAGDYTLTVDGVGNVTGLYEFSLLNLATAEPIGLGAPVNSLLDPGAFSSLYKFEGLAGQEVRFKPLVFPQGQMVWNLVDPQGKVVFRQPFSDVKPVKLTDSGTYTLLVEGAINQATPALFSFAVYEYQPEMLVAGVTVNALVNTGRALKFSVQPGVALYLDGQGIPPEDQLVIVDSTGQSIVLFSGSIDFQDRDLTNISVGDFTLYLNPQRAGFPQSSVRLVDMNNVPSLTLGTTIVGTLNPGSQTDIYQFTANQGERFLLEFQSLSFTSLQATILSPSGFLGFGGSFSGGSGTLETQPVNIGGSYRVTVSAPDISAAVSYQLIMRRVVDDSTPLIFGVPVTGSIVSRGDRHSYTFTVDTEKQLYLDAAGLAGDIEWSLTKKANSFASFFQSIETGFVPFSGSSSVLNVTPDDYELTVKGRNNTTGAYIFRLLDVANASPIAIGDATDITLDPVSQTRLYQFAGSAAQQVSFSISGSPPGSGTTLSLIAPGGQRIYGPVNVNSIPFGESGTLPFDDIYTVLILGPLTPGTNTDTYTMTVVDRGTGTLPAPAGIPLVLGATTNGSVDLPNEQDTYTFTVTNETRLYFDVLSQTANFSWSLVGPAGNVVTNRSFFNIFGGNQDSPLLELLPGGYALTINGPFGLTGSYIFRLLELEGGEVLTLGAPTLAEIDVALETDIYQFEALVGDKLAYLAVPTDSNAGLGIQVRIVDPSGAFLTNSPFVGLNFDAFTAKETGTYTVLVEGTFGTGQYGLLLQPYDELAAGLNTTITGTAGRAAIYNVTVPTRMQIYFDALTPTDTVVLAVKAPDGFLREYGLPFSYTDTFEFFSFNAARVQTLEPGSYQLLVNGINDLGPEPYAFRIVDISAATVMTPGTPVQAMLTPGTEADLYRFDAVAGDQFFFDRQSLDVGGHLRWTLIDPQGVLVFGRRETIQGPFFTGEFFAGMAEFDDIETQTLTRTGTYTLLIDGQGPSSAPLNYRFNVQLYVTQPLQLGAPVTGTQDRGGRYTFTLQSPTALYVDVLSGGSGFNWSLAGPHGTVVGNRLFSNTDAAGQTGNPLVDLQPGTYTFSVGGSNDATGGSYAFRLLDAGLSPKLTREVPLAGTLNPGSATAIYLFDGTAGERVFVDLQTPGSSAPRYMRLLDPIGNVVALLGPQSFLDQAALTLPVAGQYRLFVEGNATTTQIPFTVAIRSITDGQRALILGARVTGTISGLGEQDRYTFTGTVGQQLLFNGLSLDLSKFDVRLQKPNGAVTSLLQGTTFNSSPIILDESGPYAVIVSGKPDVSNTVPQTGNYEFRMLNLASVSPLMLGATKAGQLNPGSEMELFSFTGSTGQRVELQGLSASSPNAAWRLLGTRGQTLAQGPIGTNLGAVTLPTSGRYAVVVEGTVPGGAPVDYAIKVQDVSDVPVATSGLGIERSGNLAAGQVDTYTFTSSAGRVVFLDRLENQPTPIVIELKNPANQLLATVAAGADGGPFILDRSGTYTLTVRGDSPSSAGNYRFQLVDVAAVAQDLSIGAVTNGILADGMGTAIYRVTGSAGNRWWFDGQDIASSGNPTVTVMSPTFVPVYVGTDHVDAALPTLTEAGTYIVFVKGQQSGATPYSFSLVDEQAAPLIAGNSDTSGTLSSDMATDLYRITLLAGERVFMQGVSTHAVGDGTWSLYGPHRELLFSGTGSLVDQNVEIQAGEAGTYLLVIKGARGQGTPMAYEFHSSASIDIPNTSLDPDGDPRATGDGRLFTYEATFSQLTSMTDELGRMTLFDVDPTNGNTTKITRIVGAVGGSDDVVTQFTYTSTGLVDLVIDALGRITDYDYDLFGRLTTITMAKGTSDQGIRRLEYDLAGNITAIVDENNNRTELEYDALDRLKVLRDALGHETRSTYDLAGNVLTIRDARNNVTTNEYDVLNRLVKSTDALSGVSIFAFDQSGNVTSVTDPLGHSTHYDYDLRNRLTATTAPDQGVTRFGYDTNNNLRELIDPVGNRSVFIYDGRDRLVREIDPLGKVTKYAYDAVNNLVEMTDRNSEVMSYEYDDLDRLIAEQWVNDGNIIFSDYDKVGNLTSILDQFSSLAFTYDNRNRVKMVDNQGTPNAPRVALSYVYDGAGNILSVADAINGTAAGTNAYAYDALNRTTRVTQSGAGVTDKRVDFGYNEMSQFASINRFSDLVGTNSVARSTFGYDGLNRVTNINHQNAASTTLNQFQIEYDPVSRITKITDIDGATDYNYDATDQLTGATHADPGNPDETYQYDENGNRISSSLHGTGYQTGTGNRLLSDGTFDYIYDGKGSLIKRTEIATAKVREFLWDQRGRLVEVDDRSAADAPNTQTVKFTYDAFNRRISKTVDADGASPGGEKSTLFIYDRDDVLLDFVDADGSGASASPTLTERYLHGPAVDQILGQEDASGNVFWMLTDHLGTVRDLVNNSGAVVNHLTYDSFGSLLSATDPLLASRYLLSGREFDSETELYYYRARYYDSSVGNFSSEDPIGFGGKDANLYAYVGNNPISYTDPAGTLRISPNIDRVVPALLASLIKHQENIVKNLQGALDLTQENIRLLHLNDLLNLPCDPDIEGMDTKPDYDQLLEDDRRDLMEQLYAAERELQRLYAAKINALRNDPVDMANP